ncbi:uncharacterized protein HKW66_Vig0079610 [Vigna angularis]|uniref:Uncharacterized protein n=1 Tax=Phaseolus angularis TaxID=3914 RepID=A0A8T0K4T1_PHAAN|nr:uncharacterized protein HKW66_Vig0079610 [Vigna angularis]
MNSIDKCDDGGVGLILTKLLGGGGFKPTTFILDGVGRGEDDGDARGGGEDGCGGIVRGEDGGGGTSEGKDSDGGGGKGGGKDGDGGGGKDCGGGGSRNGAILLHCISMEHLEILANPT